MNKRWIGIAALVFVGLILFVFVAPLGMMFWNLKHNPLVAKEMAEGLRKQFPELEVKGLSGYEPTISIVVIGEADEKTRKEIKNWIFEEVNKKKLGFHIALDFRQPPEEYSWLDDPTKNEWRIVK
jgi:hypothetical protein